MMQENRFLAVLIDPSCVTEGSAPLTEDVRKDTVQITVVDRDGHAVPISGTLQMEPDRSDTVYQELAEIFYQVSCPSGRAWAISIDHEKGCLVGASDPRKDGLAIGH